MADFINPINRITPSYPVSPVQPVKKDPDVGNRKKQRQHDDEKANSDSAEPQESNTTIDEHV